MTWNGATCQKLDPEGKPCLRSYHHGDGHVFRCRTCLRLAVNGHSVAKWDPWQDRPDDGCVIVIHARMRAKALCARPAPRARRLRP
jgi:hypothetical protein